MALMPKRVKHRKQQRGRVRGEATRGNYVVFGEYGLQTLQNLNVLGGIGFGSGTCRSEQVVCVFGHGRIVKGSSNLAKPGGWRTVFLRDSPC